MLCAAAVFTLTTILPQDRTPQSEERGLVFCCASLFSRWIDQPSAGFLFLRIVRIAPAVAVMRPPSAVKSVVPIPPVWGTFIPAALVTSAKGQCPRLFLLHSGGYHTLINFL